MEDLSEYKEEFPRKLSIQEIKLLNTVLPESKPGYKKYRDKIKDLYVTGFGRFGRTNLILGNKDQQPEPDSFSSPIFAAGTAICSEAEFDIIVHSEKDNEIEVDISPKYPKDSFNLVVPGDLNILSYWSYSEWNPGEKAPGDSTEVREVILLPGKYIFAAAPVHKKIWLHEFSSGVNFLIPVTNFYNQLMLIKNIRDIAVISNQDLFFNNLKNYSDKEIISAFILYNKYFHKFKIDLSSVTSGNVTKNNKSKPRNKFFSKILKRGTN